MFTITDEDRALREEGRSWRNRLHEHLIQESDRYVHSEGENREETIQRSSLGAILQERTAALRLQYREDRFPGHPPFVRVIVSQDAIASALGRTRMKVMNEVNVRKLIYRHVSDDFAVTEIQINRRGSEIDNFIQSDKFYTVFVLSVSSAD